MFILSKLIPDSPIDKIITGHVAMILCCLFYLAWWIVAFHPLSTGSYRGFGLLLLLLVLGSAFLGILLILHGIRMIPETPAMPFIAICCLGVLSYLVLLLVTSQVFHRVPTAELFLMTAWAVLELVVVSALKGTVFLPPGDITIYAIIFIATGIGLAAYMAYYSLDEMLAYYCGMVPLLVNMAAMWVIIRKISSM